MLLTPSTRLGHYEILALLGEGGMGEVYRARDVRLGREVAIKVLPPETLSHPLRKQRFLQEAQAASALNHPNIVTIYDIGSEGGIDFIAMEYVKGKTLGQLIHRQALPAAEVLQIAIPMTDALAKAHSAGIVHRDLKPANVMISDDGHVKLLDFGLAKPVDIGTIGEEDFTRTLQPRTAEGTVVGTAPYMSPEQAEGKPLDARSDIFSFGAVLYEMITGARAFAGSSQLSTLSAVLRDEPRPAHEIVQNLPLELEGVVLRCLRKEPGRRFQSMAEVRQALEDLLPSRTSSGMLHRMPHVEREPSIAVLPFANLSQDKENEYFSDGLAEEIINALSGVPGLRVTARTSAFAFRGKDVGIPAIGDALRVGAVLEGSVRKAGNRVRITVQLVNADDGYQIWSDRYDRDMTDIFEVQDEISRAIVDKLKIKLVGGEPLVKRYTENVHAYQAYLQGLYNLYRYTPTSLELCRGHFEEAIRLDPNYALAYTGLTSYYCFLAIAGIKAPQETIPMGRSCAEKALELDRSLAEAHSALGLVYSIYDYNWPAAQEEFRTALELNPDAAGIRARYAFWFLAPQGRLKEAVAEATRASELDPLAPVFRYIVAQMSYTSGEYERAIEVALQNIENEPSFWVSYWPLTMAYAEVGRLDDAIAACDKGLQLFPGNAWLMGMLGGACALLGRTTEALAMLDKLAALASLRYVSPLTRTLVLAPLGRTEEAFAGLQQAYEQRDAWLGLLLRGNRFFQTLRSDARFPALLRQMNLMSASAT